MNPTAALNLALILFLPWYAILGVLYWVYPRQPRTLARRIFDVLSLAAAILATVTSMHWSFLTTATVVGSMWPQILATSVSYGVFLGAMTAAFLIRRRFIAAGATRHASSRPVMLKPKVIP